jgi:hypothetical protein
MSNETSCMIPTRSGLPPDGVTNMTPEPNPRLTFQVMIFPR